MHLCNKKPCKQYCKLLARFRQAKSSFTKNALYARFRLCLRHIKRPKIISNRILAQVYINFRSSQEKSKQFRTFANTEDNELQPLACKCAGLRKSYDCKQRYKSSNKKSPDTFKRCACVCRGFYPISSFTHRVGEIERLFSIDILPKSTWRPPCSGLHVFLFCY